MKRNLFLIVLLAMICLILSRCEELEFEPKPEDKPGADTTNVDTTGIDTTGIDSTGTDTTKIDTSTVDTPETRLIIDGPSNDTAIFAGDSVVLRWHIENAKDSITYNSIVGYYLPGTEYVKIDAGENTEYVLHIPYPQTIQWFKYYWPFEWSVTVKSSDGKTYRNKATVNGSQKIRVIESQLISNGFKTEIQDTTPGKFDYYRNINVTFYWYIRDPKEGKNYNYTLYLEWVKVYIGYWANVYNSNENKYEEHIVGSETEYTLELSQYWNWSAVIKWRVKAEDDEGQVYGSDIREITILPRSKLKIILYYPVDDTILTQGDISYSWKPIEDGTVYGIFFDKGVGPFDRYFETWADVGESTEYTKYMSAGWWSGFCWGVAAQAPDGSIYRSEIRSARIIKE